MDIHEVENVKSGPSACPFIDVFCITVVPINVGHYPRNDLLSILKIWEGGLAIYGGIIGGFLAVLYNSVKYEKSLNAIEGVNDKAIKKCISTFPNLSKQPELAKKAMHVLQELKRLDIYKLA